MIQTIYSGTHKARKEYNDDGAESVMEWRNCGYRDVKDGDDVKLELFLKTCSPYKISKGDSYHRQFNNYDGDVYIWRTKDLFYYLTCKYHLFDED